MEDYAETLEENLARLREERSRQVRDAMEARARDGYLVGRPRIGYRAERTPEGTVAVPDTDTAPLVARAFSEVALNGLSLREATGLLQENGLKGRRGEPVSRSTVYRILSDPFYAGTARWGGVQSAGRHQTLVSRTTFAAVRRRLARRRK